MKLLELNQRVDVEEFGVIIEHHLGAAMGTRASANSASAMTFAGMRTPTVGNEAVTMSGMNSRLVSTIVRGPGQNSLASFSAAGGQCVTSSRAALSEWT